MWVIAWAVLASAEPVEVVPYGILKPTVVVAGAPVESFGRPNLAAATAAGNPVLAGPEPGPQTSFQVAQTRLGIRVSPQAQLRGVVEVDFIDFDKATPTTTALPRLRIASVEWRPTAKDRWILGQTWDLTAPRMPHHFELVGANFEAGNLGFMRHQLQWLHGGDRWESGLAVGFPAANGASASGPLERSLVPTLAGRVTRRAGAVEVALSALATSIPMGTGPDRAAWVGVFSAEATPKRGPNLRLEGYIGQNTSNLGMLTLGHGREEKDIQEVGGWFSARGAVSGGLVLYATSGAAAVLQPSDVAPAYVAATEAEPARRDPAAGPGIRWNSASRLGAEVAAGPGAVVVEAFGLATEHALFAADQGEGQRRAALGGQLGFLWRF